MKASKPIIAFSLIICILALYAAGTALINQGQVDPVAFNSLQGKDVMLYGEGLYQNDSVFAAAGFIGQDLVTVFIGIPMLAIITFFYARGSQRAHLLLTGMLAFFLYVYASMALKAAYNNLFLVYVALFSCCFYAFILAFTTIGTNVFSPRVVNLLPRRAAAILMFASGLVTLLAWILPLLTSLAQGQTPGLLEHYTTMVTDALDLAVITPATFASGVLILRRDPLGYRMLFPLLGTITMLLPVIIASTYTQISAGVTFSIGEILGPISCFALLGVLAVILMVKIIRIIPVNLNSLFK